jgi:hypothetical protein
MPLEFTDGAIIETGISSDGAQGFLRTGVTQGAADDDRELGFVVELDRSLRPLDRFSMGHE